MRQYPTALARKVELFQPRHRTKQWLNCRDSIRFLRNSGPAAVLSSRCPLLPRKFPCFASRGCPFWRCSVFPVWQGPIGRNSAALRVRRPATTRGCPTIGINPRTSSGKPNCRDGEPPARSFWETASTSPATAATEPAPTMPAIARISCGTSSVSIAKRGMSSGRKTFTATPPRQISAG